MTIYKTFDFEKRRKKASISNAALEDACREMSKGLVGDALGSGLFKKRLEMPGKGKRGGYRLMVAAVIGERYFFLYLFPKNARDNITSQEKTALRSLAKLYLAMTWKEIQKALNDGDLIAIEADHE